MAGGARDLGLHTHPSLVRDVLSSCAPVPHRQGNCTLELQSNCLAQQLNEREMEQKAAKENWPGRRGESGCGPRAGPGCVHAHRRAHTESPESQALTWRCWLPAWVPVCPRVSQAAWGPRRSTVVPAGVVGLLFSESPQPVQDLPAPVKAQMAVPGTLFLGPCGGVVSQSQAHLADGGTEPCVRSAGQPLCPAVRPALSLALAWQRPP